MAEPGRDLSKELFGDPEPEGGIDLSAELFDTPKQDDFQPTQYGFKVRPITIGNTQTVQREDGAAYFGPEQGNKGRPGWFNEQGQRLPDDLSEKPGWLSQPWARIKSDLGQANRAAINDMQAKARAEQNKPFIGQIIPEQIGALVGGPIKGTLSAARFGARLTGSDALDQPIADYDQFQKQAFGDHPVLETVGQVLPMIGSGGASAAPKVLTTAERVRSALAGIGKAGAVGGAYNAVLAPHQQGQTQSEFFGQAAKDFGSGTAFGAGVGAIAPAVGLAGAVGKRAKAISQTPSAGELLDELGSRLGGKAPGVALQDAANAKYNAAWDEFKKVVEPVDAEAANAGMDYSSAIGKLKEILGVGGKRAPMSMPDERRKVLQGLLADLEEAGAKDGGVSNSFADAIGVVKRLGAEQRRLAVAHGDTEARAMLGEARDAILKSMEESSPELSAKAKEARSVFASKVAPLFDKSEGGQYLTQIRDTPTPGDLLGSANQGALTRMKADKARIIAKGSSADPLLYSYLDAAIKQGAGKPGSFATSMEKAMPAVEAIADQQTLEAFHGLVKVAKTANWSGTIANLAAASSVGHANPGLGASAGVLASFKPAMSGPGLMWKLLQSPSTRKLLSFASKAPQGSPELELIARDLSKTVAAAGGKSASNVAPLRPSLPAAASTGTTDQIVENK